MLVSYFKCFRIDIYSDGIEPCEAGVPVACYEIAGGHAPRGSRHTNKLDIQLTYVIQQAAIANGVDYEDAVELPESG